jgi:histidine ammonia-lyase
MLADDRLPTVRDLGGLGTGDLTVLAQLGLALAGEGEDGGPARLQIGPGDALPLMSSNAATFATAALVWADLGELLDPARRQDPFGLRCLPPVAGAFHDALAGLHDMLAVEINAAAENPLSRAARRCTTAASTRPAARWRSTACGWRWSPSAAWRARAYRI